MGFDTHFLTRNDAFGFSQSPSHFLPDVFDNTLELDGGTLITKVSTALVTGIGGKEGAVRETFEKPDDFWLGLI